MNKNKSFMLGMRPGLIAGQIALALSVMVMAAVLTGCGGKKAARSVYE